MTAATARRLRLPLMGTKDKKGANGGRQSCKVSHGFVPVTVGLIKGRSVPALHAVTHVRG